MSGQLAQHKMKRAAKRMHSPNVDVKPMSRVMARRSNKRQKYVAVSLLLAMFAGAGTAVLLQPDAPANAAAFDTSTAVTAQGLTSSRSTGMASLASASRSSTRESLTTANNGDGAPQSVSSNEGTWDLDGSEVTKDVARQAADNLQVAILMTTRDSTALPNGFNPNHAVEDNGNSYPFSQCTWWAYKRRQQLGLPVGSHYGNGHQWADSARQLGYWVDNTPRQGDVMVFQRGQDGSSLIYGHVAIVETVNADGSIETSECGASYNGHPFTRHFTAEQAAQHQFIHY